MIYGLRDGGRARPTFTLSLWLQMRIKVGRSSGFRIERRLRRGRVRIFAILRLIKVGRISKSARAGCRGLRDIGVKRAGWITEPIRRGGKERPPVCGAPRLIVGICMCHDGRDELLRSSASRGWW